MRCQQVAVVPAPSARRFDLRSRAGSTPRSSPQSRALAVMLIVATAIAPSITRAAGSEPPLTDASSVSQPATSAGTTTPAPTGSTAAPSTSASQDVDHRPQIDGSVYGSSERSDTRHGLDPFPSSGAYLAYSIALDSEALITPGNVCPKNANESCVLGSGAGLAARVSFRTPRYSLGAAYSATFHGSSSIYERGVLQQLRGEWRYRPTFAAAGDRINGYVGAGAGFATYGDEWAVATYGPSGNALIGGELELSVKLALQVEFAYRLIYFRGFEDASGQVRPAGFAQMLGIQLGLELRDPL